MITRAIIDGKPCLVADLAPGTVKILFDDGTVVIGHEEPTSMREDIAALRALIEAKGKLPTAADLKPYVSDMECYVQAETVAHKWKALKYDAGFFVMKNGQPADHAWTKAPDGTIYDTTYSQFDRKVKVGIWKPGSPEAKRYRSYEEHHPESDPDFCLLRALKRNEPCQVEGCTWTGR